MLVALHPYYINFDGISGTSNLRSERALRSGVDFVESIYIANDNNIKC